MRAFVWCLLLTIALSTSSSALEGQEEESRQADATKMSVKDLKAALKEYGLKCKACSDKGEFVDMLNAARAEEARKQVGGSCRPREGCEQGCDLCSSQSSQAQGVCGAMSFCEWAA
eukprot:CAMPEP_0174930154 /NCGR_PEP_ID=MMETSP1355-20121228/30478_1 /TAXON_ID=464990 /ORGANISM="Hemiselmis tepida, Strain CCMP443" /LENGTH=115 /DNA_ID=CAMNT_0016176423 /DNA_START=32 /DNA_END=376 /DNA_ORIENTATION=+